MSEISDRAGIADAPAAYSTSQVLLHWIIAALIIFQLVFGESIKDYGHTLRDGEVPSTLVWLMGNLHIWVGVAVLALTLARLALRLTRAAPPAPALAAPLLLAMRATYALFYALLLAAPVTGLVAWYGGVHISGEIHEILKPVFIVLITLHVLAALWHRFVLKDDVMSRMSFAGR